jgi:hypothetical protein
LHLTSGKKKILGASLAKSLKSLKRKENFPFIENSWPAQKIGIQKET